MVGGDDPARVFCIPTDFVHLRLEAGVAIQIVVSSDPAAMGEDLLTLGVLLGWHVAEFFEQGDIDI